MQLHSIIEADSVILKHHEVIKEIQLFKVIGYTSMDAIILAKGWGRGRRDLLFIFLNTERLPKRGLLLGERLGGKQIYISLMTSFYV